MGRLAADARHPSAEGPGALETADYAITETLPNGTDDGSLDER